ncbi:uncharacterized protein BDR25DRAFT_361940 [Lindgomyces ingoldianus]|uniref:Uncharacterized protein n=1 Tax=Lindgomyces ingoldianus TaxID=673940 RepID=A0ACB6QB46_9PLEO|nr:uncharacterized protein BDR25DRAFT_361940 [Lindgomyces ingoldianus]KAF2464194.1 hypothetical protein BDR25DRAFT_361940 [Lindgomyces ingoldianus]
MENTVSTLGSTESYVTGGYPNADIVTLKSLHLKSEINCSLYLVRIQILHLVEDSNFGIASVFFYNKSLLSQLMLSTRVYLLSFLPWPPGIVIVIIPRIQRPTRFSQLSSSVSGTGVSFLDMTNDLLRGTTGFLIVFRSRKRKFYLRLLTLLTFSEISSMADEESLFGFINTATYSPSSLPQLSVLLLSKNVVPLRNTYTQCHHSTRLLRPSLKAFVSRSSNFRPMPPASDLLTSQLTVEPSDRVARSSTSRRLPQKSELAKDKAASARNEVSGLANLTKTPSQQPRRIF